MDVRNKTITLNNNEKYVVLDIVNYINRSFLLLTKVINEGDNIDKQLYVAENNDEKVIFVKDQLLIDEIIRLFRSK